MSIKFSNTKTNQNINIKLFANCKIGSSTKKNYNNPFDELPYYTLNEKSNKNIKLNDTQYKILTGLANGTYSDYCDAIDTKNVLTEDDLSSAYERFKNGENIFGIKIKEFKYQKNFGKVDITAENGETLSIDIETEFETKQNSKLLTSDYWEKNSLNNFHDWKKLKAFEDFLHALGKRESQNNYSIANRIGYLGRYQLGEQALIEAKFYNGDKTNKNDWQGKWSEKAEKYDVNSKKSFLANPEAQDQAMYSYIQKQIKFIKHYKMEKAIGKIINGIKVTFSGLLAACHLVGVGSVKKYIESNGKIIRRDGNNVSLEEYLKMFAGFNLNFITGKYL